MVGCHVWWNRDSSISDRMDHGRAHEEPNGPSQGPTRTNGCCGPGSKVQRIGSRQVDFSQMCGQRNLAAAPTDSVTPP